jgi:DNA polymerase elongation subunit (family B)
MADIVFHLLDIQARDMCIEAETEDAVELAYESASDDDGEIQTTRRRKPSANGSQRREFLLHLFGATETGRPIRCDVTGFRPTLYLRLPEEQTSLAVDSIKQYINKQGITMGKLQIKRVTKKIFYGFTAGTFYPFLQIDVPSLSLFRQIRGLFLDDNLNPTTKRQLDPPLRGKTVEVFEANLDPMLRFLHCQNIQPCGWVMVKGGANSISQDSDAGIVLECDYEDVVPTAAPRVSAPFLTASWDIECFSMTGDFPLAKRTWKKAAKDLIKMAKSGENAIELLVNSISPGQTPVETLPKGMTPIYGTTKKSLDFIRTKLEKIEDHLGGAIQSKNDEAVEELESLLDSTLGPFVKLVGDPVIQIGTTLTRGTAESIERHLFVFPNCVPIPGIVVHAFPTERAMIMAWIEWMAGRNPDILIGYNVFGFDESYLWYRAEELGIIQSNSPIHALNRLFELAGEMKLEEKFLSSSAMGDNRMYIWTTQGRLQIDMFHYIKRNNVLPSYKLDEVTKHFMSGKLKGQEYSAGILRLTVAGAIKDVKEGRSITLLDDTGETVSPKLVVHSVDGATIQVEAAAFEPEVVEEMQTATRWVIVKDDVSPQDIFRLHRGSAEDRAVVGKYCLQDCDLVLDLYKKLETFNNSMSMANVCSVPVSYIFTRGQGIKIESLMFKYCRERGIVIPVLPVPSAGAQEDSYEGAIVLDPQPGFYATSPVGVCDFASLYPSTIVSENISHDSLLWVKDFTDDGALISHRWGSEVYDECPGFGYTDIEFDIIRPDPSDRRKHPRKIKCGRRICRFAQPLDGTKSTLPQITTWLLTARSAKKKEMKAEKDPERYALLDAEQLAYKLTGNSLYGQLGSGTFKIRLQALAASVTAYGRKQILFAKAAIERFYGPAAKDPRCSARCMAKVVYGDSVTGDTLLRVRYKGIEQRIAMENLWMLEPGKNWITERDKDFYELDYCESWTETGWTRIHRIIRHDLPSGKNIIRVFVRDGHIDVTEDHSLILHTGESVSPRSLHIGSRLLSTTYADGDMVVNMTDKDACSHPLRDTYKIVYDLTTENHHFQAGPEGLIVHNTDSLFVEFNPRNPQTGERLEGREARQATIDITDEAGHFITKALAAPHDFEFDKAFDPLLMFSKKRYAGNMYEENADDYVHKYMGIALKRRDNAPIVKTIFGGAMRMLLDKRDVNGAFRFVKEKCMELVDGKVSLGQLTVTKSLRADYADPARIAHKALADRITLRDPGNAPAAGDRIGYVYIAAKGGQEASKLQGERIETPQFIKENDLVPDYRHYIEHQLQNPISQAFGLLIEDVPGFDKGLLRGCPTAAEDLDGYLAFREGVAARLLFSESLKRSEKESTRSAMSSMFNGKAVITVMARPVRQKSVETEKPRIQSTGTQRVMSNYMYDSMVVSNINKKQRAERAAKKKEDEKSAE